MNLWYSMVEITGPPAQSDEPVLAKDATSGDGEMQFLGWVP